MKFVHLLVIIALQLFPSLDASDWPRFRGAQGDGVAMDSQPPVKWSSSENIRWKVDLPGPGTSSPIVFGDRIYVTCHTGYGLKSGSSGSMSDLERHLIGFKLSDGEEVFKKSVKAKLPESDYSRRMEWHGYASSTPIADDHGVICFFGKSGVYSWSHDGKLQWHTSVGDGVHG